ncbi:hypothetical protein ACJJTC_012511 [Scirpophaga incertulas]
MSPTRPRQCPKIVFVFASTKDLADELVDTHQCITINTQKLPIRPLTRNKRIILSNVCPVIPHKVLENKLQEMNITTTLSLTFIRAGINEPVFNHILSFRRQIYIVPEDVDKLPERLQIDYDDISYWIYLTTETMTSFICQKQGHIASKCTETTHNFVVSNKKPSQLGINEKQITDFTILPNFKRSHPPTDPSNSQSQTETTNNEIEFDSNNESDSSQNSLGRSGTKKL